MLENHGRRNAAGAPVADALLGGATTETQQPSDTRRAVVVDDQSDIAWVHGRRNVHGSFTSRKRVVYPAVRGTQYVYGMGATGDVFQRMLSLALERRGWDRAQLTRELDKRRQDLTNWKSRGIPPRELPRIARTIGCTVEELLGTETAPPAPAVPPPPSSWPFEILRPEDLQGLTPRQLIEAEALLRAYLADLKQQSVHGGMLPDATSATRPCGGS